MSDEGTRDPLKFTTNVDAPNRLPDEVAAMLAGFTASAYELRMNGGGLSICTPFIHGDGDGWAVILERCEGGWCFTDRGEMAGHLYFDNFKLTIAHRRYFLRLALHFGLDMEAAQKWTLTSEPMPTPSAYDLAEFIGACARVEAFGSFLATNKPSPV